jgi:2-polyprenyl-3-methyl-5-hydroxy-6-metoxy-1,4-benzoquinol methylase
MAAYGELLMATYIWLSPDHEWRMRARTIGAMSLATHRRAARRARTIETSRDIPEQRRWNHNIHYFPVLLAAIPAGAQSALDVGCGDGMLARRLRDRVPSVVGIDLDADQIALAQTVTANDDDHDVAYVYADVLTHPFNKQFDAIVSVATLHHLDTEAALSRLAELVAPGGVLAIEGLARSTTARDFAHDAAGAVLTQVLKRTGGRRYYEHSAPIVWPPTDSFFDVRRIAEVVLPGACFKRHALWRYTVIWNKPGSLG